MSKTASPAQRLFQQAEHHRAAGRARQAEALYLQVLKKDPRHPGALYQLGILRYRQGKLAAAARDLQRAAAAAPADAITHSDLGVILRQLGRRQEALHHYRESIRLDPSRATTHNNLGNLLVEMGQNAQAIHSFQRALECDSAFIGARLNLADSLRAVGRLADAEACCRQILQAEPANPGAHNTLGAVHVDQGRLDDAIAQFRRATELAPSFALAYRNWGTVLQRQGRVEEAVAAYRKVLALAPQDTTALRYLSRNVKFKPGDPELARMEQLLGQAQLTGEARIDLHFALGKACDDAGDYAKAFENFSAGNRLVRQHQPYSAAEHSALVDRLIQAYSQDFFAQVAAHRGSGQDGNRLNHQASNPHGNQASHWGSDDDRPVFVLGMPRSGTTLVEQILASHPQVFGAGEVSALLRIPPRLPGLLGTDTPYPECLGQRLAPAMPGSGQTPRPNPFPQLATDYLALLTRQAGSAARVVDKTPFNFLVLGLIALLFPRARVIHCQRDPRDTGLSCFVTRFTDPVPFAADLADIGAYQRDYHRLMEHWRQVLGLPLLEVQYENLVAHQEDVSRRMIDFLDLPWSERCLAFHQTQRVVQTASTWQVRQPMYQGSIGRWRHYQPWLQPLSTASDVP